jgi:hypothetical protein
VESLVGWWNGMTNNKNNKQMKTETFIVLVSAEYSVREELDNSSAHVWESKEHFLNKLCFEEDNPIEVEEVTFIPIYEFVDWWNDQDDHTEEFYKINPTDSWMGYAVIKTR